MKSKFGFIILSLCLVCCKNISFYPIDTKPSIKVDTNLYGIWKAVEDTDKANYIKVEGVPDFSRRDYYYYFTRVDHHGTNRHFDHFPVFTSNIDGNFFLMFHINMHLILEMIIGERRKLVFFLLDC